MRRVKPITALSKSFLVRSILLLVTLSLQALRTSKEPLLLEIDLDQPISTNSQKIDGTSFKLTMTIGLAITKFAMKVLATGWKL